MFIGHAVLYDLGGSSGDVSCVGHLGDWYIFGTSALLEAVHEEACRRGAGLVWMLVVCTVDPHDSTFWRLCISSKRGSEENLE